MAEKPSVQEAEALRERATTHLRSITQLVAVNITVCVTLAVAVGALIFTWSDNFSDSIKIAMPLLAFAPAFISLGIFRLISVLRLDGMKIEGFLQVFANDKYARYLLEPSAHSGSKEQTSLEPLDHLIWVHWVVLFVSFGLFLFSYLVVWDKIASPWWFSLMVGIITGIAVIFISVVNMRFGIAFTSLSRKRTGIIREWLSKRSRSSERTESGETVD